MLEPVSGKNHPCCPLADSTYTGILSMFITVRVQVLTMMKSKDHFCRVANIPPSAAMGILPLSSY
jgi:hypothetical protein